MPIEIGKCPECEQDKPIMPRAGVCRQCYSKIYYKNNKEKFQEYYKKLTQPQSDDSKQPAE